MISKRTEKTRHGSNFEANTISLTAYKAKTDSRFLPLRNRTQSPTRRVSLNHHKWSTLKMMLDYLNMLMMKYVEIPPLVKAYYQEYVDVCRKGEKEFLLPNEYFTTQNYETSTNGSNTPPPPMMFNMFRLFNEIPLILDDKLFEDLHMTSANSYLSTSTSTF